MQQSPNAAEELAGDVEISAENALVHEPKPFKSQRFESDGSISGTWPRPAIVMNGHEYKPFKLK